MLYSALHGALKAPWKDVEKVKALSDETLLPQSQKYRSPTLKTLFDVANLIFMPRKDRTHLPLKNE